MVGNGSIWNGSRSGTDLDLDGGRSEPPHLRMTPHDAPDLSWRVIVGHVTPCVSRRVVVVVVASRRRVVSCRVARAWGGGDARVGRAEQAHRDDLRAHLERERGREHVDVRPPGRRQTARHVIVPRRARHAVCGRSCALHHTIAWDVRPPDRHGSSRHGGARHVMSCRVVPCRARRRTCGDVSLPPSPSLSPFISLSLSLSLPLSLARSRSLSRSLSLAPRAPSVTSHMSRCDVAPAERVAPRALGLGATSHTHDPPPPIYDGA